MSFIPAVKLRAAASLKSFVIFFASLVVILGALLIWMFSDTGPNGTVSAAALSLVVFAFVLGICTVREDMRLLIQFGVSRRTSFLTRLCAAAVLAVVTAIGAELLLIFSMAVAPEGVAVFDLYQIIYRGEDFAMTAGDHLRAIAMNAALVLALYEFGEFFSLAFYRTNKYGAIALGIFIGLFPGVILPVIIGLPGVREAIGPAVMRFFAWLGSGVWALVLASLVFTLVMLLINYLLMRRAPIKAAKG